MNEKKEVSIWNIIVCYLAIAIIGVITILECPIDAFRLLIILIAFVMLVIGFYGGIEYNEP